MNPHYDKRYVTLEDFHDTAKSYLSDQVYGYYSSGANDQITLKRNEQVFDTILLNPRVCVDVEHINTEAIVLGEKISMPICIAPTAMEKLCHKAGEINTAKAAAAKGVIMTLSTLSTTSISEVAESVEDKSLGIRWYQLYVTRNRAITENIVRQAEEHGFKALVITVDAPFLGKRISDERNKFSLAPHLKLEILESMSSEMKVEGKEGSGLFKLFAEQIDSSLTWKDIAWLKKITHLPIVLKGIMCYEDAKLAAELGVHVWVSNHGGRELDTVRATIEILGECVKAVEEVGDKSIEVYIDGGIRRGSDVVKCIALGAKCVFLGRPALYANASEGEQGIEKMLTLLHEELILAMRLVGATSLTELRNGQYIVKNSIPKPNL